MSASRHLLGLRELQADSLRQLLHAAHEYAQRPEGEHADTLAGRVVANLFFEDSTRTRLSFTLAAQRLSAVVIDLAGPGSSLSKGESIADTAQTVEAMGVDALIVRHRAAGAARIVSEAVSCAVINAGDGKHEHPTQGLLDIYTLATSHGRLDTFDLSGLRVAIVGDIVSSRVARSNIAGLTALGAEVVCVGPSTLVPASLSALGCTVMHDLDDAIDTVKPDAMNMLRIQFERHTGDGAKSSPAFPSLREYVHRYGLSAARAERLTPDAIVMHPGPMNRGIEIEGSVADGPRSVVLRQVANGLPIRMAALARCVQAA